ncbi:SDR family NAD(P)-dependent oxidoreductase [Aeromicrobium yanjiei]|uniref:SDR family NAD(P)-dependent oxidoreductase n=1 Tax=Aeromicrobium yanjiei TaxID=2662028 RepID=UPI001ABB21AF|nr:SDR family oxidoreductase [Aeromicrobium yanjiei]
MTTGRQLEGRKILVTGAATGIGAAAVHVFAAEGATVTATYRHSRPGSDVEALARWLPCDFRDEEDAEATVAEAARGMGGLDVLLHAAGRWAPGLAGDVTRAELDDMLDTNVKATVFANQAAFRAMSGGGGRIINLGSGEAITGVAHAAAYSLSKGAVHSWTRAAARSWGSSGVTVNALVPAVETPGAERLREYMGPAGAAALHASLATRMAVSSSSGEGLGDPVRDLGPMMVFLAGEGSRFVTGQLLSVTGGMTMLGA